MIMIEKFKKKGRFVYLFSVICKMIFTWVQNVECSNPSINTNIDKFHNFICWNFKKSISLLTRVDKGLRSYFKHFLSTNINRIKAVLLHDFL